MKRLTDEELSSLQDDYVDAAVELVARQGWPALAVRNVGKKVGKSGNSINRLFKGPALKRRIINRAFWECRYSVLPLESDPPPGPAALADVVIAYLRKDAIAAPLMAQVVALVAAPEAPDAAELHEAFRQDRKALCADLASVFSRIWPDLRPTHLERKADALVAGYIAACVTIVTHPSIGDRQLYDLLLAP